MKLLLEYKADLLLTGDEDFTVLHSVMNSHKSMECLKIILDHQACTLDLINARYFFSENINYLITRLLLDYLSPCLNINWRFFKFDFI